MPRSARRNGRRWFTAFFHAVYVVASSSSSVTTTDGNPLVLLYYYYYHQPAPEHHDSRRARKRRSFISLRLALAFFVVSPEKQAKWETFTLATKRCCCCCCCCSRSRRSSSMQLCGHSRIDVGSRSGSRDYSPTVWASGLSSRRLSNHTRVYLPGRCVRLVIDSFYSRLFYDDDNEEMGRRRTEREEQMECEKLPMKRNELRQDERRPRR